MILEDFWPPPSPTCTFILYTLFPGTTQRQTPFHPLIVWHYLWTSPTSFFELFMRQLCKCLCGRGWVGLWLHFDNFFPHQPPRACLKSKSNMFDQSLIMYLEPKSTIVLNERDPKIMFIECVFKMLSFWRHEAVNGLITKCTCISLHLF
jgi:hypothetical protein